jgi:hypothetical protein
VLAFITSPYWIVVIPTVFAVALVLLFARPTRARSLADQVERGETVRPGASGPIDLHVKSLPVTLTTLGENELPAELTSPSLRYPGRAGGVLVLYDWKAERVIRVPTDSVVVMTPT